MAHEKFLIHEVAELTGRHINTIRGYLRRGVIDEPQRTGCGGYRLFTKEDIETIKEIRRKY